MKKLMKVLLVGSAVAIPGAVSQAGILDWSKPDPVNVEDIRTVVQSLRPTSKGGDYDVYVSMNANGAFYISIKLPSGADISAVGGTVKATLEKLRAALGSESGDAKSAAEAVDALLNSQKASQ